MNRKYQKISLLLFFHITSCVSPYETFRDGWFFQEEKRERIVRTAERYIGVRYKYGGTSLFGFDCSGFVRYVYQKHGIELPRGSKEQYESGRKLSIGEAQPGDLVFFSIEGPGISHVGIYLGGMRFIHSPGTGKKISYAAIDSNYWKGRFVAAAAYF